MSDEETKIEDAKKAVIELIMKAADQNTYDSNDAMKFSQAALNAANALETLRSIP